MCAKKIVLNPATYTCKNAKYLVSTIDDSAVMSDEIIEATKHFNKNYSNKKYFNKCLYFTGLLINYHSIIDSCQYLLLKQKHLGPYHVKNKKLNKFYIDNII